MREKNQQNEERTHEANARINRMRTDYNFTVIKTKQRKIKK